MLVRVAVGSGLVTALVLGTAPAYGVPVSTFEMPFSCAQSWTGSTRSSHSPNPNSIDWNRPDDAGDPVVAAASGVVSRADPYSNSGYGHLVVIDHGRDEETLYAHLDDVYVVAGQRIDKGAIVGMVGSTGGSTGPHLHFEERQNGRTVPAYFHGRAFAYGSTLSSNNCPDVPMTGDFDGDGKSQLTVFRRYANPRFLIYRPGGRPRLVRSGTPLGQPVTGDWDGDGRFNVGQRGVPASTFALQTPSGTRSIPYGVPSDRAIAGDWNGDGLWQVGVWRPTTATFYLRGPLGYATRVRLGEADDVPVAGDWNGDRRTDVGVFDPLSTVWTLRYVARDGSVRVISVRFGRVGGRPVVGDWDGNGRTDLGTWSPWSGVFTKREAASAAAPTRATREVTFGHPE